MENTTYDYNDAVRDDFINAIEEMLDDGNEDISADDVRDQYYDSITGNDNGSYTCNRAEAEDNVKSFIFGEEWEDFINWMNDSGNENLNVFADAEKLDVLIRSFILDENYNDWFNSYDSEEYLESMRS